MKWMCVCVCVYLSVAIGERLGIYEHFTFCCASVRKDPFLDWHIFSHHCSLFQNVCNTSSGMQFAIQRLDAFMVAGVATFFFFVFIRGSCCCCCCYCYCLAFTTDHVIAAQHVRKINVLASA